ncbi:MAG TPA: ABC transporter permease [Acidobacteriota bacterium]|nr:ABC transporter permease [Acidobacteriota bacterium]
MSEPAPPYLARRLVRLLLPAQGRHFLADLETSFKRDAAQRGAARARLLYWKEALSPSLLRLAWELRRRRRERAPRGPKEWIMSLFNDFSLSLRGLRREPLLTAFALLSLTLAIGANTAVFSIIHPLLLSPLNLPEADRLVRLWEIAGPHQGWAVSPPNLRDWREQNEAFEVLGAYTFPENYNLSRDGRPEVLRGIRFEPEMARVLKVEPMLGRLFRPDEDQPGKSQVAVLSHRLWQRLYAGRETAVGDTLELDGQPHQIIGVLPPGLQWPPRSGMEIYRPLTVPPDLAGSRNSHWINVAGRLKPGVKIDQARQQMQAIAERIERQETHPFGKRGVRIWPLYDSLVSQSKDGLHMLWGAVSLILLIGCANVANLLLARGVRRRPEMAVRSALGASRTRLLRLLLGEGLILALAGGTLGVLLCLWMIPYLTALPGSGMPLGETGSVSLPVLGFSFLLSLLTALAAGILPALRASRSQPDAALKERRSGGGGETRDWLRGGLVTCEVALAVVVLTAGGLLLKSYFRLTAVDPGLDTRSVLTASLPLNGPDYDEESEQQAFYRRLLEEAASMPGVRHAGLISLLPLREWGVSTRIYVTGSDGSLQESNVPSELRIVGGDYFQAAGVELLAGRLFRPDEERMGVIVNQAFAQRFLNGENPVGRRIASSSETSPEDWIPIVGMVADVHNIGLHTQPRPEFYMPLSIQSRPDMTLVLSASVEPMSLAETLRERVRGIDPRQPLSDLSVMSEVVHRSLADRRFRTLMMGLFAFIALVLALTGVYSVLSFTIGRRVYEIAVRSALGARRRHIYSLVLKAGLTPAAVGIGLGLGASLWIAQWLRSQLFAVQPIDPLVLMSVALLMLAVASAASLLPARRAARVDPAVSLRAN